MTSGEATPAPAPGTMSVPIAPLSAQLLASGSLSECILHAVWTRTVNWQGAIWSTSRTSRTCRTCRTIHFDHAREVDRIGRSRAQCSRAALTLYYPKKKTIWRHLTDAVIVTSCSLQCLFYHTRRYGRSCNPGLIRTSSVLVPVPVQDGRHRNGC